MANICSLNICNIQWNIIKKDNRKKKESKRKKERELDVVSISVRYNGI